MVFFEAIISYIAELAIISWVKTLGMWTRYIFLNLFSKHVSMAEVKHHDLKDESDKSNNINNTLVGLLVTTGLIYLAVIGYEF